MGFLAEQAELIVPVGWIGLKRLAANRCCEYLLK